MEEWRATQVDGYEVSDQGHVRSVDRTRPGRYGNPCRLRGRVLNPVMNKGYATVALGFGHRVYVHHCVLLAFIGERPPGAVGRHLDGNCHNNAASNLAWGSAWDNSQDARRHGTVSRGESRPMSVLTDRDVMCIRVRYANGETGADIARELGASAQSIMDAITGKTWGHIPGAVPSRGSSKVGIQKRYAPAKWRLSDGSRTQARADMRAGMSCRAAAKKWEVSEATMRRIRDEQPV